MGCGQSSAGQASNGSTHGVTPEASTSKDDKSSEFAKTSSQNTQDSTNKPELGRRLSSLSEKSLNSLSSTDRDLTWIEQRVTEIGNTCHEHSSNEFDLASIRTELAQLESKAKALETKGIDDVYTGELHSGKDEAKNMKKQMLHRCDMLFTQIDAIFKDIQRSGAQPIEDDVPSRRISAASEASLSKLAQTNNELIAIESQVELIDKTWRNVSHDERSSMHQSLSQLESRAKQLEGAGVDDVQTGDLHSGKQEAKASKTDMLKRLEVLFSKIDSIFADMKKPM